MARRAVLGLFAAALAAALPACESTQDQSARLAKGASKLLAVQGVKIAHANRSVAVVGRTVLRDANGVAAVVTLRNSGPAQAKVPLLIALRDAKGRTLYSNAVPGLDPSLTSVSAIARGDRTFWVNNQIQAARPPRTLSARVGVAAGRTPAELPQIEVTKLKLLRDTDGAFARGVIANRSKVPQRRLVVSCLSRRGGRIVAAGRAIVDRLPPAPTPKPQTFRVYFIGDPAGGEMRCVAPPTVIEPGGSA